MAKRSTGSPDDILLADALASARYALAKAEAAATPQGREYWMTIAEEWNQEATAIAAKAAQTAQPVRRKRRQT